ncbi:MAG: competence/damage-inducible protein A [Limnochordia bacterium]|jgi:nicotinamide-nucleotide amidase|nr:competence/damage-inducible protein A [Limnochordia bacterium]
MRAELIMVGTELLLGEIVDTNAAFLARNLADLGIDVYFKSTVGDNLERACGVLKEALKRSDLVILSGGLGPTDDDLTREIVATVTKSPLREKGEVLADLEEWFAERYGPLSMPEHSRKQAQFPEGSEIIPNPVGTAPGFSLTKHDKQVIALPGVPQELKAMFMATVAPALTKQSSGQVLVTRNLHFVGIGESSLEEILGDLLQNQTNPTLALYASGGTVRIRLAVKAASQDDGYARMAPVESEIRLRTRDYLYGTDEQSLEAVVAKKLLDQQLTLALAESCTGGLIGHRLTNVPGSSGFLERGFVVYSNRAKVEELGVSEATLNAFGAVSEETAKEMAEGARRKARTDLGLAVTGIAGPGGGTESKPVGLVYISLASAGDTIVQRHLWKGTREQIKHRATLVALRLLWQS